ncbi:MAG: hypothetical protein ABIP63_03805, partial [Thermoanaerobaculia bacterium]
RRPRPQSALKAGVSTPFASGPIASARVVSSVTRRIDGRGAGGKPAADSAGLRQAARVKSAIAAVHRIISPR